VIPNDLGPGDSLPVIGGSSNHGKDYMLGQQELQRYEAEIKDMKIERSKREKQLQ